MTVSKKDIIKLAKRFNMSHHYERKQKAVAPHHFKEQMKIVDAKAKAETLAHQKKRKDSKK
ncbi:hypothetical protein [Selenomonas ruminantium]|uniref:hypothetical protein n=1 Tax=Selenomonas ruminantium TaxID=971 RepID=UPI0026E93515|nr:hypothetical protein [Selenomonas ruminantium]